MERTALAAVGYMAWMIALLVALASLRTYLTLSGKRAANAFAPDGSDVSPFSGRLCRAHANCYEAFPVVVGPMLVAIATGQAAITAPLAGVVLVARIAQSIAHLVSTSVPAVLVRFTFFLVQVGISTYWCARLVAVFVSGG